MRAVRPYPPKVICKIRTIHCPSDSIQKSEISIKQQETNLRLVDQRKGENTGIISLLPCKLHLSVFVWGDDSFTSNMFICNQNI